MGQQRKHYWHPDILPKSHEKKSPSAYTVLINMGHFQIRFVMERNDGGLAVGRLNGWTLRIVVRLQSLARYKRLSRSMAIFVCCITRIVDGVPIGVGCRVLLSQLSLLVLLLLLFCGVILLQFYLLVLLICLLADFVYVHTKPNIPNKYANAWWQAPKCSREKNGLNYTLSLSNLRINNYGSKVGPFRLYDTLPHN